jgi:16S rRNA (uracil1498-N3)-methyltransferase
VKGRPRFFAPEMTADSRAVTLPEDEAAHLVRVLRLGPGDDVHVLNGRGLLREARVSAASKSGVTLDLGDAVPAAVESRLQVTLAQALLKADKMDDVVRDAAMAGAFAIQPLVTGHTEPSVIRAAERRQDRWRTIAIGSAKQSGRAVIPSIGPPLPVSDVLAHPADARIVLVEPSSSTSAGFAGLSHTRPLTVTLFVGPEGGWSPEELQAFSAAGVMCVTLPGPTWRADAIGLVAIVLADIAFRGRDGWTSAF